MQCRASASASFGTGRVQPAPEEVGCKAGARAEGLPCDTLKWIDNNRGRAKPRSTKRTPCPATTVSRCERTPERGQDGTTGQSVFGLGLSGLPPYCKCRKED